MNTRPIHDQYARLPWLIVAMTAAFFTIGVIADRYIEHHLVAAKGHSLALAAGEIAHKLDLVLAERASDVQVLSHAHVFQGRDTAAQHSLLDTFRKTYPLYLMIGVTDAQGRFVAATDRAAIGLDMGASDWFLTTRKTRTIQIRDVEPSESAGGPDTVSFTAPILGPGDEFLGVITSRIGLPLLEDVVSRTLRTFQAQEDFPGVLHYRFATLGGSVFVDSEPEYKGNVNLNWLELPSARLSREGKLGYVEEHHPHLHNRIITGYALTGGTGGVPELKWAVLLYTSRNELVAPIRALLLKLAAAWVVVWVPMLVFSLWSTKRLRTEWTRAQVERNHAEAVESKYRQLVEQASDIIYRVDLNGYFTYINLTVTRYKGYTREELIGQHFTEHIRPDAREATKRFYMRQFARRTPSTYYEFPVRRKDGGEIWLGQNVELLIENGRPVGFQAVARDITERKKAEEALAASDKRWRAMIEAQPECVKITAEDGLLLEMNAAGLAAIEADSLEQVRGQSICPLIAPAYREDFIRFNRRVYQGQPGTMQYEIVGLKGRHRWMDTHAIPLKDELNTTIGVLAISRDITERKQAEDKLLLSQEIIANAHDPISVLDLQGRFTYQNASHASLLGFSTDELLGKTPALFLGDEVFASICRELERTQSYRGELIARTKNGALKSIDLSVFAVEDAEGKPACFAAIKRDITERKREEKNVQALLEGTASVTGEPFFPALVRALAGALGVRHAFVTELFDDEQPKLRILAIWSGDRPGNPAEYDLAQTPCENVIAQGEAFYPDSVQALFPGDTDLTALGAVGYLGLALTDSSGKTIGHLCIVDDKPFPGDLRGAPLLRVFASRAAAELERKQAEEALVQSERRLALVLDATNEGIWDWNIKTGEVYYSPRWIELLGYEPKDVPPHISFWESIVHPDDMPRTKQLLQAHFEGQTPTYQCENRLRTKAGIWRWNLDRGKVIQWDTDGHPIRMVGTDADITERKRAEKTQDRLVTELAESRNRFEMFFRKTPSAISITTIREGRFLDLNKQAEVLTGYSREELIGRTTVEMNLYVDPSDRPGLVEALKTKGILTDLEREIRTKSGAIRTAIFSLVPIQMGTEPCLLSIAHDITERKQAEHRLREQSRQQAIEAELSVLAVTIQDQPSLLSTAAGLVANALEVNYCEVLELIPNGTDLRLCASAGWRGDEIGQVRTLETGSLAHAALNANKPVIRTLPKESRFGGPKWLHEHGVVSGTNVSIPGKDGPWGVLGVYTTATRTFSRDDVNFLQTVSSILGTAIERMQTESVLRSANQSLRLLSRQLLQVQEDDRRAIARDLHDEIGQSLTAIKLNVERAQRTGDRDARARILRDCAQITDRVLGQVRSLSLDLHPSILDDLGLPFALKWYADLQGERAGLKVELTVEPSLPRLPQEVEVACYRIAQEALTNVVRHARASLAGIVLKQDSARVELCITDDGVGFVVGGPQTDGRTSVGLASMQERAKLLGGTVKITSAPHCGTTVVATLPLPVTSQAGTPAEQAMQP